MRVHIAAVSLIAACSPHQWAPLGLSCLRGLRCLHRMENGMKGNTGAGFSHKVLGPGEKEMWGCTRKRRECPGKGMWLAQRDTASGKVEPREAGLIRLFGELFERDRLLEPPGEKEVGCWDSDMGDPVEVTPTLTPTAQHCVRLSARLDMCSVPSNTAATRENQPFFVPVALMPVSV